MTIKNTTDSPFYGIVLHHSGFEKPVDIINIIEAVVDEKSYLRNYAQLPSNFLSHFISDPWWMLMYAFKNGTLIWRRKNTDINLCEGEIGAYPYLCYWDHLTMGQFVSLSEKDPCHLLLDKSWNFFLSCRFHRTFCFDLAKVRFSSKYLSYYDVVKG